jgi:hypothetical protein
MPALHNRLFDIEASYTENKSEFDYLVGVKLEMIIEQINSEDITIEFNQGELYIEWVIDAESFNASFVECENY